MTVEFWNFSKKKNSTKVPSTGSGTSFTNVQLKDDCSILNPVITVAVPSMNVQTVAPVNVFTYCYIAKFQRYYFVTDWVYVQNRWQAQLSIDVLASHKTAIGASSQYVIRSASVSDGTITDILYPATTAITQINTPITLNLSTTGFYVIGLINNSSSVSEGAISYYLVTAAQMANIKSYLMSNTFLNDNNLYTNPDVSPDLLKSLFNPFQYIVSCKYFPFNAPSYLDNVTSINFGWWTLPYPAARIPEGGYIVTATSNSFTARTHPQAARGSYLNHAPYTDIVVYHPLIGNIPLDMAKINAGDVIQIITQAETVTGTGYITIRVTHSGTNYILYNSIVDLAINVPLAQMNIDTIGVARTAVNAVGNIVGNALSLNVGGVISSAGNGVLDALQAQAPVLQSSGTPGTRVSFVETAKFITTHRTVVDDDNTDRGRPLCQIRTINTLSGYIKCGEAHFASACLDSERDLVEQYMINGFFYE